MKIRWRSRFMLLFIVVFIVMFSRRQQIRNTLSEWKSWLHQPAVGVICHVQESRKRRVRDVCNTTNLDAHTIKTNYMIVDKKHKLLFCIIPKTGCTTTLNLLAEMAPKGIKKHTVNPMIVHDPSYIKSVGLNYVDKFKGPVWDDIVANYTKLMVVRHPFLRLASAYWDKMSVHHVDPMYRNARISVVKAMSRNVSRAAVASTRPLFQEFISMRLNKAWKFEKDRHWRTYHDLCSPCAIPWDYIVKLESFAEEMQPILKILEDSDKSVQYLKAMVAPKNKSDKLKNGSTSGSFSSTKQTSFIVSEYFDLSMQQRNSLLDIFGVDMALYGYGFEANTASVSYDQDCKYGA